MEVLYRLQETAKKEFVEDSSTTGKLTTGIRVGTRTLFEMQESVSRLDMIGLDTGWGKFRDLLKSFHNQRMATVQEMNQIAKAMLSGPAPGVNYGEMTARAPELTAQVEQIDKSMFQMSQALFLALVDDGRVDADGNLHHLILNKKDRAGMVHTIDIAFGRSLDDNKNSTSIVSAAWAIKYGLTRPIYKAAEGAVMSQPLPPATPSQPAAGSFCKPPGPQPIGNVRLASVARRTAHARFPMLRTRVRRIP
jgi:hypothetical protein